MSSLTDPVYFGTVDYVLLAIMLSGSMGIGLYFAFSGGRQRTRMEYLLAERQMSALPVCLSLFATFQSAIALLGIPTETYRYGAMYLYQCVAICLSYLVGLATVIPLFYPLKLTSVYEYLGRRFESGAVQQFGAAVGVIANVSYMTVALLSPSLALETAVGIPLWLSIIVMGVIGTVYTTLGGLKSVIWTDVFQTFFMFLGVITVLVKGTLSVGGLEQVWRTAKGTGRLELDVIDPDPRTRHTVWSLCFGSLFFWLSAHFSQSSVQRIVSLKSMQDANKVYMFIIPISCVFVTILIATGLVLTAYIFGIGCDPLEAGYIKNQNQIPPFFVLHTLRSLPGVSGLYIATVFSGSLSTLSSGINSLAANAVEDFLSNVLREKPEHVKLTITKILVGMFGAVVIGLAFLAKEFQGPVTQMSYISLGATYGPLTGMFVLGALSPQSNSIGALLGCSIGLVCSLWLAVGSSMYGYPAKPLEPGPISNCSVYNETLVTELPSSLTNSTRLEMEQWVAPGDRAFTVYDLSYVWNPFIGILITVVAGFIISIITNTFFSKRRNPEPELLFPFCRAGRKSQVFVLDTEHQMNTIGKQ